MTPEPTNETPETDAFKETLPGGIEHLEEAVWVANQYLEHSRSLERRLRGAEAMLEELHQRGLDQALYD
jgi:hypothetical protein